MQIRCSALHSIMSNARGGSDDKLSVGAKTYVDSLAKQHVYGFISHVDVRQMQKGIAVEPESIKLLNRVLFTSYEKNSERRTNEWLSGTCDIFSRRKITDVKSSWSLRTFPATVADADNSVYEWQVRGYMILWDADSADVAHCMVDTPDELIGHEDESEHKVSHIRPELRVTRVPVEKSLELEDKIKHKVEAAQRHYVEAIEQIYSEHKF